MLRFGCETAVVVGRLLVANTPHAAADIASRAETLRLLAGDLSFLLLGLGIICAGLLAVPVLARSAGDAVAKAAGWPGTLSARLSQGEGRGFYGVIAATTVAMAATAAAMLASG